MTVQNATPCVGGRHQCADRHPSVLISWRQKVRTHLPPVLPSPSLVPPHPKMRQKRAKAYRKLMHLYCHFFGFRQPYQMLSTSWDQVCRHKLIFAYLVDSETCLMAVAASTDLVKQLGTVLQGDVKPSEHHSLLFRFSSPPSELWLITNGKAALQ